MCKSKFLKSVVCGMLIAFTVATSAFAGTVVNEVRVRGESRFSDYYSGGVGHYSVSGYEGSSIALYARNTTGSERLYHCTVKRFNYNTMSYDMSDTNAGRIAPGQTLDNSITRNHQNAVVDYLLWAEGYNYPDTTTVKIDDYKCKALQYYRD